jgi:hypothetical protein
MAAIRYRVVSMNCSRAMALGKSSGFLNSLMTLKKHEWLATMESVRELHGTERVFLK